MRRLAFLLASFPSSFATTLYDGMDDEFLLDQRPVFPDDSTSGAAAAAIPSVGGSGLVSPALQSYLTGNRGFGAQTGIAVAGSVPLGSGVNPGSMNGVSTGGMSLNTQTPPGLGSYPNGLFSLIQQSSNAFVPGAYSQASPGTFAGQPPDQARFQQVNFAQSRSSPGALEQTRPQTASAPHPRTHERNQKIAELLHRKQERMLAQEERLDREAKLFEDAAPEEAALSAKNVDLMRLRARQKNLASRTASLSTKDIEREQLRDQIKAQKLSLEEASEGAARIASLVDPAKMTSIVASEQGDVLPKSQIEQMRLLQTENSMLLHKISEADSINKAGEAAQALTECPDCGGDGGDAAKLQALSLISPPPPEPSDPLDGPLNQLKVLFLIFFSNFGFEFFFFLGRHHKYSSKSKRGKRMAKKGQRCT